MIELELLKPSQDVGGLSILF